MTRAEAMGFVNGYYFNENPTEDDMFLFVEAMHFLIERYRDPQDMHNLAFFYLEQRCFELELKYLEMAAEYDYPPALEDLGYIWYYGLTGTVDYEKAYGYFLRGMEGYDDVVRFNCEFKVADMYRNGFYVDKDEDRYRDMIERLYQKMVNPGFLNTVFDQNCLPFPDVAFRLAGIRETQERISEAIELLNKARVELFRDISRKPTWWGNYETMEKIVTKLHELDPETGLQDLYDLFWLIEDACMLKIFYFGRDYYVSVEEGNEIRFEGKWYRSAREFFEKAEIKGRRIVCSVRAMTQVELY